MKKALAERLLNAELDHHLDGEARGKIPGRKKALSPRQQQQELHARVAANEPKARIARDLGISRETLYAYLKDRLRTTT
jgi:FixJ family two-component response regulator